MRPLFSILFVSLILQSCSSGTDPKTNTIIERKDTVPAKEKFPSGQIIDRITNGTDASQSYAMYLPPTYSADKKYPILIALDAHGDGKLPITKYRDLADRYGYIIVGSYDSQNGLPWEQSQAIVDKLLTDVRARLSVNEQRIYLLGFSGGARVANGIAMSNGSIAGVICCGAAAPAKGNANSRDNYFFMGIAGNKDFNYTEMRKYDLVDLAGYRIKHFFLTFDGKHEWQIGRAHV